MKLLRVIAIAVAIFVLAPPPPASAQISPNASWSCTFANSPTDCGFYLQAAASSRATITSPGRDEPTAAVLTTQPGDSGLFGSGTAERADVDLGTSASYCNQGQQEWWAHSIMFPSSYVVPPAGAIWNWGVVFDFHHTGPTGQPNFQIASLPTGLEFWVSGGPTVVNGPTDPGFHRAAIGPVTKNVWYDFVYHVKWSSGSDGFFQAWLNGKQLMNYIGATLYVGQSCYLKLANYHTPLGVPISVIHSRVVRGATQADVQLLSSPGTTPPPARDPVYDFSSDGKSDILWRNSSTGQNLLWLVNAATITSAAALATVADLNWSIAGAGDFNGDGKADILWRNHSTGQNQIWFMNGGTLTSAANINTLSDLNWTVVGVGDFNGDGKADILWRNRSTGQNQIWFMNGGTLVSAANTNPVIDQNRAVVGVADFNGDGKADILWHNKVTGENRLWLMNGSSLASSTALQTVSDLNWHIVGVADFDGDGRADILWRNSSTGQNKILFMNGATALRTTYIESVTDLNWKIVGVGDYNGDGKADILWRNGATGQNSIFFMNGGTVTSQAYLPTMPVGGWAVALH